MAATTRTGRKKWVKEKSREEFLAARGEVAEDEKIATSAAVKTLCIPFKQPELSAGTKSSVLQVVWMKLAGGCGCGGRSYYWRLGGWVFHIGLMLATIFLIVRGSNMDSPVSFLAARLLHLYRQFIETEVLGYSR